MTKLLASIFFFVILLSCASAATLLEDFNDISDWAGSGTGGSFSNQTAISVDGNAIKVVVDGAEDSATFYSYRIFVGDGNTLGFFFRMENVNTSHQAAGVVRDDLTNGLLVGVYDSGAIPDGAGFHSLATSIDANTWYFALFHKYGADNYDFNLFDGSLNFLETWVGRTADLVDWTEDMGVGLYVRDVPVPAKGLYADSVYDDFLDEQFFAQVFVPDYNVYDGNTYSKDFNYNISYSCPSWKSPADINLLINDVNTVHYSLTCNSTKHDINGSYTRSYEGLVNAKLHFAPDDNVFYDQNIYFDFNPPTAIFDINAFASYGFNSDYNAIAYLICDDNVSPDLLYSLTVNDTNIVGGWFDTNSIQDNNFLLSGNSYDLNAMCVDLVGNSVFDSNTYRSLYSINLILINEETGDTFNLDDINGLRVISPDNNFVYDFKSESTTSVFYVIGSDDSLRFELTYDDGTTESTYTRDITMSALGTDFNARICVPPYLPTFYEQIIASSLEKRVTVKNPYSDCYVIADYTKYAYQTYLINRAWTIDMRYNLYVVEGGASVVLAEIEGSIASLINLDTLGLGQTDYDVEVLTDQLSLSKTTETTYQIYYKSLKGNNNKTKIVLYDEDNNVLFTYTETGSPNEFTVYYDFTGETIGGEMLHITLTKTLNDGSVETETRYFGKAGEVGLIDGWLAVIISGITLVFALTFVGRSHALGWFGIVSCLIALAFLTLAIPTWYVRFMQAVVVIVLIFIGLIFKNETAGVT